MKAMILAAGLGTRLKPLTDKIPKALVKISGKTLLEHVITSLKNYGVNEIIINLHHYSEQIINFIKHQNNFGIRIEFSSESELLDTGGGLKKASWFFENKPFVLHNVDVLSNLDLNEMMSFHKNSDALVTLAVKSRKTTRYFLFDENDRLSGWENTTNRERLIISGSDEQLIQLSFMGIQIISPKIFEMLPNEEKFSIVDWYLKLAGKNVIKGFRADSYSWIDCGKADSLTKAENIL